jgi:hypothetical protein
MNLTEDYYEIVNPDKHQEIPFFRFIGEQTRIYSS